MSSTITIPIWFFTLLAVVFVYVSVNKFIWPSLKWFFRKKVNTAINELNKRLNIRLKPFQLTKRQVLLERLVYDQKLLDYVQQLSIEDEVPHEILMERVNQYAREIVPSFNAYLYYRFGFWLSKKLAKLLYRVRVGTENDEKFEDLNKDATIVFVMNHRSNMDYILVSFLVAEKTTLSYAVGEWAQIWPLRSLIRSMGAYFVRRNSRNPLYRKVLERYISMATREGVSQAVFPEGGLTRDGKIRPPKLGFLDYMLRDFDHKQDKDILFIPVGINYDRVLEDRTLLRSLDPDAETKSRWYAIKTTLKFWVHNMRLAYRHQWKRFGYASVRFSQPVSAREYCRKNRVNFSSLDKEKRFEKVEKLADELMHKIERTIPVVPVVLLASVFVKQPKRGIAKSTVIKNARKLMEQIEKQGGHILFPHKDKQINLDAGLEMLKLRRLIEDDGKTCRITSDSLVVLQYYAHSIDCWLSETNSKNKAVKA
ncbi:MAG: 1-acyl-sn-glycerol-3-phosphate acyltransferase [Gammaproteobacteria bacterium]|nr:1-acyl-sn-glycerol-3-phosphate acyltransferase [Gammaproteobacteria bacterium]MDH5629371.1 1-acyl-sn-glycerol-3-phosphate acyltransferase [Gammaproteobacteria bacterium]